MPYFPDLNTYLHQSSLLIQAYPTTTRITTKYSLPRKPNPKAKPKPPPAPTSSRPLTDPANPAAVPDTTTTTTTDTRPTMKTSKPPRERLPPSATLTLKTFEPGSGICLKYKTDKAAEVGRLLTGLGRLAAGEVIEMPAPAPAPPSGGAAAADKMEVDEVVVGSGTATPNLKAGEDAKQVLGQMQAQQGGGGGGGVVVRQRARRRGRGRNETRAA